MSKSEPSEMPFPQKNITSGNTLERCAFLFNMREWVNTYETVNQTDKSKHSATWMWDLIMHGIIPFIHGLIPYEWPTDMRDEGELHLRGMT
jgi:hypothetical protein